MQGPGEPPAAELPGIPVEYRVTCKCGIDEGSDESHGI